MSFADDLLEQAFHLANKDSGEPKQASLRRAVSTAYYALFHLLIDEAVGNWSIGRQRSVLARIFEHAKMKSVCEDYVRRFYSSGQPATGTQLNAVAQVFVRLQDQRHTADYNHGRVWSRTDALQEIKWASKAFEDWRAIRDQVGSQDFLLQLFLPKSPRQ